MEMSTLVKHRGPDDSGEYRDLEAQVALGMRRLSILDLEGGHQPMSNEDGSIWIVFNGEIYNSPDLRPQLEVNGHRFRTSHSDTEVLIHLYEDKQEAMLEDLNGMFAFVIYDKKRRKLFGTRDRFGIKPLYYIQQSGLFAFASELKSLLMLPFVHREIDLQSLFHYMTLLYVPDQASIIQGIGRVPPGHWFVYDLSNQKLIFQRYWQFDFRMVEHHSEEEWTELLRIELRKAVKRWTLSDVPIACSLSGGIDSPAIVSLLAEQGYSKIKTYSVGFVGEGEESWNEIHLARQVAQKWGTEHHEIFLKPDELLQDLVSMVWHLDEPYAGGLPSWYVFREMSKDVKVGLTGTGGDELFGNYGRSLKYEAKKLVQPVLMYRQWVGGRVVDRLAQSVSPFARLANHLPSSWRWIGQGRILSQLPQILSQPLGHEYYPYMSDDLKRTRVLQVQNGSLQGTASYLQQLYDTSQAQDLRNGIAVIDFRTQLAEEFLFMTDRFSMAHSLEARVPFLDHALVEMVFRIPPCIRTSSQDIKYLLKRTVSDLLPSDLLTAPKHGFEIPIELWLRRKLRPLAERLLHPQRLRSQGIFRPEFYDYFVRPHLEEKASYTYQVWAALMFQLWYVLFVERKQIEAPAFDWQALC
jgi:asparagine synthase (glutamine-hydrolysing)